MIEEKSKINFDFQELPIGPKALEIYINDRKYSRIQKGQGKTYRVYLKDHYTDIKLQVEDPFYVYLSRFIEHCMQGTNKGNDHFDKSAFNLILMSNILLNPSNQSL